MKRLLVCATLALLSGAALHAQQPVEVALFPLTVTPSRDSTLVRLADSCITLLTGKLRALGVTVVRRTSAAPKDWSAFRAAPFAITGTVARLPDGIDVELDLLDAATGDELRAYLYRGPELNNLLRLGEGAGERIKAAIRERRK